MISNAEEALYSVTASSILYKSENEEEHICLTLSTQWSFIRLIMKTVETHVTTCSNIHKKIINE